MEGGSCVAVLEESSTWMVMQQPSREDRSGLFLWLEQRDHHAQPSVARFVQLPNSSSEESGDGWVVSIVQLLKDFTSVGNSALPSRIRY